MALHHWATRFVAGCLYVALQVASDTLPRSVYLDAERDLYRANGGYFIDQWGI